MSKKFLIVVGGATASGKTAVAIQLAQQLETVILSADSRQFYKELSIGTAKPTAVELEAAPHLFINSLSIHTPYSVGDFERDAIAALNEIYVENDIAILAGGSGLFIRAVCEGLDVFPEVPADIQKKVMAIYEAEGLERLQYWLEAIDPVYYATVDQQNPHRLIRAIAVTEAAGQPFSSFRTAQKAVRAFQPIYILLEWERAILYDRINQRVDQMMVAGLLEEVKALQAYQTQAALQTVGYQELFAYLEGEHSLEMAVELIKRNTRRYAKRQLTWFRKRPYWKGFAPHQIEDMITYIENIIAAHENLEAEF